MRRRSAEEPVWYFLEYQRQYSEYRGDLWYTSEPCTHRARAKCFTAIPGSIKEMRGPPRRSLVNRGGSPLRRLGYLSDFTPDPRDFLHTATSLDGPALPRNAAVIPGPGSHSQTPPKKRGQPLANPTEKSAGCTNLPKSRRQNR